ncbi:MAG: branched-chain amino acid ABC transporter permease [Ktedonobacterales bacterium]
MSIRTQQVAKQRPSLGELRTRMDSTKIAGRSTTWYLSGWRLGLVFLVLAILLPTLSGNEAIVETGIGVGIFVILALGLNIVVGYAGLLDLGYVAFFAIGAYTVALGTGGLVANSAGKPVVLPTISWWLLLPAAAILAALFGVVLGAPTLRLRGDYLAIVTLGFGEIVPLVFNNVPFFFGPLGLSANAPDTIGPLDFGNPVYRDSYYYLTLALVVLVILGVTSLRDSSLGRAWIAIREDETAAATSGVNLVRTKLLAFGLGALVGGIGGALFAGDLGHVDYTLFSFQISITVLIMIVLGGLSSIPGVILGAIILRFFDAYLLKQIDSTVHSWAVVVNPNGFLHFLNGVDFNVLSLLIYGILLVVMVRVRPQGLIPDRRRRRELHGEGASVEGTSAVGLLAREEAGDEDDSALADEASTYAEAGSDAAGRE